MEPLRHRAVQYRTLSTKYFVRTANISDYLLQHLEQRSGVPRNRQIYRLLRQAILDGVLAAATRLPSSRDLALQLAASRNTVLFAYQQLLAEGYLEARPNSGTFVAQSVPEPISLPSARLARNEGAAPATLSERGESLIARAGAGAQQWGAFVPGVPDVRHFPCQIWNSLQSKIWRKPHVSALVYGGGGGHLPLRQALAEYLGVSRSVACESGQVVITSGIHQSMDLCMRILSDPGDLVWVEDPCYWGARNLFAASGLRIRPIRVDAEGIAPTEEDMKCVPRFIFVTPSHQYPMGMVMSLARRTMLLAYAREHGCWIIEVDYDSEFRYAGRPLPSLQGMDQHERVLYMGTFSKTMFPGLRLGYLVLPTVLAAPFITGMEELYRSGQTPLQATMHQFMAQGHFEAHIRRMRLLYGSRLDVLRQAIDAHGPALGLDVAGSEAGLHLTLLLPQHADDRCIAREAIAAGIVVRPLSNYFHDAASAQPGLVLGYACVDEPEMAPAFATLVAIIEANLRQ